jgi:hypothetical protein
LAFNVSTDALDTHIAIAEMLKSTLSRVVFAVPVNASNEKLVDEALARAQERLSVSSSWLRFTLFKYDQNMAMDVAEGHRPYRITHQLESLSRPSPETGMMKLAAGDLFRVRSVFSVTLSLFPFYFKWLCSFFSGAGGEC